MNDSKEKTVVTNRKARFNYEIVDSLEAGLVLSGSEVKSIRQGRASLKDAYARIKDGEVWLIGMHISPYQYSSYEAPDPLRDRKLLLNRHEIKRLGRQVEEKGFTLIPLRLYFKGHLAKVELGLARGKRQYDKKEDIARRDAQRDLEREQKQFKFKM